MQSMQLQLPQKEELLKVAVHLGHLTNKWNPKMAPYIFMEKKGLHIIDVNKTLKKLEEAMVALQKIVFSGKKVMMIGTKRQASKIVEQYAQALDMPYVTERWLGGMLTNFMTIRKSLKKMVIIDKKIHNPNYQQLAKKEKTRLNREKVKLEKVFKGVAQMNRLPGAIFVVDAKKEHIAIQEAKKLKIPIVAILDTNANPTHIDYPIPSNDDNTKAIALITASISKAIETGVALRKKETKEEEQMDKESLVGDDGLKKTSNLAGSEKFLEKKFKFYERITPNTAIQSSEIAIENHEEG